MATKTKKKGKSKAKKKESNTGVLQPVKKGKTVWLGLSSKILSRLRRPNARARSGSTFYWTLVDGVLQLSMSVPTLAIPVMRDPVEAFVSQSEV